MCIRDSTNDLGTDILEEDIPAEYLDQAQEYREKLVEAVAETDEDLMMKYLEGEEITNEELKAGIRKATINVEFFPVSVSYTHLDVYKRQR